VRGFGTNGVVLDAAPATTVTGCVIQANGNGLRATGNQAGSAVVGNTFTGNRGFGIHLYAATGLNVDGNSATGVNTSASMGLYATGDLAGTRVVNNVFRGGLRGALLSNATNLVFGEIGQGNTLTDNVAAASNPGFAGTGLRAEGVLTRTTVTGNTIARNNYGLAFVNARNLVVQRNRVERNNVAGIFVDGINTGSVQAGNVFGTGANKNAADIRRVRGSRGV
jgi:parallel beta-helix repeat protein